MAYNEELAGRVRAVLADRTDVEEKRMFGGLTFDFSELVAQPHVRPFDFTGRPMQGMVYVGNDALDDPQVLRAWVQRGTDYVVSHSAVAKRRKRC